jgi:hypothetical protein
VNVRQGKGRQQGFHEHRKNTSTFFVIVLVGLIEANRDEERIGGLPANYLTHSWFAQLAYNVNSGNTNVDYSASSFGALSCVPLNEDAASASHGHTEEAD